MRIRLNGQDRVVENGATLAALVESLELDGRPIAIEVNRRVVPKSRFRETRLNEGDTLEVVTFVGGG